MEQLSVFFDGLENEKLFFKEVQKGSCSFERFFKSPAHQVVFFLLSGEQFCFYPDVGDFEKTILEIDTETKSVTDLAVQWKRRMFSTIDSLSDISEFQKTLAKTSVIEYWRNMNIAGAPEEDLADLVYVV